VKPNTDHVNLRVSNQDGSSVTFKIKKHASLKKLMNAYCAREVSLLYSNVEISLIN